MTVKDRNQALVSSHLNSADTNPEGMLANGTVPMTGGLNLAQGADVVAANALVLGTDGNSFDITGTTTITSIATLGVGTFVTLQFDEVLTITHHATDLVLPNGADIVTKAGDICTFYEYAVGDWRLVSSNIVRTKGSDVASAAALPVINDGDFFDVTGTTTITSINSIGVGKQIVLQFDGALTITHHATDLILPGGANILTAAGDVYTFREYAAGDWIMIGQGAAITATTVVVSDSVGIGGAPAHSFHNQEGASLLGDVWPTAGIGATGQRVAMMAPTEDGYLILANNASGTGVDRGGQLWLGARGTTATADVAVAKIIGARESAVSGNKSTYLSFLISDSGGSFTEALRLDSTSSKTKVIDIGDWDMDATSAITVAHGLTLANIRSVTALVRDDAGTKFHMLTPAYALSAVDGNIIEIDATNVSLSRTAAGYYDSVAFDSTSYNRGWITITYIA
jgi:hypothetical protein